MNNRHPYQIKENIPHISGCLYFALIICLVNTSNYDFIIKSITYIFTFCILFTARVYSITFILSCITITFISIYYPFSIYFKISHPGVFESILQTNHQEAKEFLSIINYKFIIFYIISALMFYNYTHKNKIPVKKINMLITLFISIYFYLILDESLHKIKEIKENYTNYKIEIKKINEFKNQKDTWEIKSLSPKKDIILVVIGESVKRKYLSIYGSKYNTTPFLNKSNGDFYTNYISPAGFTTLSIPRTLALTNLKDNSLEYGNNIISLAKKAGYTTYWISNQGFTGTYETPTSSIAAKSDHIIYKNIYISNTYYPHTHKSNDLTLIEEFKNIPKSDTRKLIVLHMLGSHADFCKRLDSYELKHETTFGKKFNCYLSTINLLDHFIEKLNNELKKTKNSFSIIYFSDHGLNEITSGKDIDLIHSDRFKDNFDVPLFILRNDDTQQKFIKEPTSGLNFINIFAKELGVETNNLNDKHPIKVLTQNQWVDYNQLAR